MQRTSIKRWAYIQNILLKDDVAVAAANQEVSHELALSIYKFLHASDLRSERTIVYTMQWWICYRSAYAKLVILRQCPFISNMYPETSASSFLVTPVANSLTWMSL